MSVRNGPSEGNWSVFAEKVMAERDEARAEVITLKAKLARKCTCEFQTPDPIIGDPVLVMECGAHAILFGKLQNKLAEARDAIKAMIAATDEWAAEFTQKKRAMNWGIVNDAYLKAEKILREE